MSHSPRSTGLPILASWRFDLEGRAVPPRPRGTCRARWRARRSSRQAIGVADLVGDLRQLLERRLARPVASIHGDVAEVGAHRVLDVGRPSAACPPCPPRPASPWRTSAPSASPILLVDLADAALPPRQDLRRAGEHGLHLEVPRPRSASAGTPPRSSDHTPLHVRLDIRPVSIHLADLLHEVDVLDVERGELRLPHVAEVVGPQELRRRRAPGPTPAPCGSASPDREAVDARHRRPGQIGLHAQAPWPRRLFALPGWLAEEHEGALEVLEVLRLDVLRFGVVLQVVVAVRAGRGRPGR